jgi:hypothetical protein
MFMKELRLMFRADILAFSLQWELMETWCDDSRELCCQQGRLAVLRAMRVAGNDYYIHRQSLKMNLSILPVNAYRRCLLVATICDAL